MNVTKKTRYFFLLLVVLAIFLSPFTVSALDPEKFEVAVTQMDKDTNHGWLYRKLVKVMAGLASLVIDMLDRVLWFSSVVFEASVKVSVAWPDWVDFEPIKEAWRICRDFANVFFVFILLYIAIQTILQISGFGTKELLIKVLILAMLINFSGVVTRVTIDASNIFALHFYESIKKIEGVSDPNIGMGGVVARAVKIQGIYDVAQMQGFGLTSRGVRTAKNVFLAGFLGSIFMAVLAFVFFGASVLYILRLVSLIFLFILSPLAFLAMALPYTKKYASKWWSNLLSQALYAPISLFLLYMVLRVMDENVFKTFVTGNTNLDPDSPLALATTQYDPLTIGSVFYFILLIGLTIGALYVSKIMGAVGAASVIGWGSAAAKGIRKYATGVGKRQFVAKPSRALSESKGVQKAARYVPGGAAAMRLAAAGAKVGGLDKKTEAKIDQQSSFIATLSPKDQAKYLKKSDVRTQRGVIAKMKPEERAEIMKSNPEIASLFAHHAPTRAAGGVLGAALKKVGLEKAGEAVEKKSQETFYGRMMTNLSPKEKKATKKVGKEFERKQVVKDILKSDTDQEKFEKNIKSLKSKDMRKMLEESDEKADILFDKLAEMNKGGTLGSLQDTITKAGNSQLAAYIGSIPAAELMLRSRGIIVPEKGEKKKAETKKEPGIIKMASDEEVMKYNKPKNIT